MPEDEIGRYRAWRVDNRHLEVPKPHLDSNPLRYRRAAKTVERCFSFIDLCGFTTFVEVYGLERASHVLTEVRSSIRILTSTHGVRVDKWLGDGALIVGTVTPAVLRSVLEIEAEVAAEGALPLRAGITVGPALVFEGDDYIGGSLNLAAKLCHLARPGQVLVPWELATRHSDDVTVAAHFSADVPGIGPLAVAELHLKEVPKEAFRRVD